MTVTTPYYAVRKYQPPPHSMIVTYYCYMEYLNCKSFAFQKSQIRTVKVLLGIELRIVYNTYFLYVCMHNDNIISSKIRGVIIGERHSSNYVVVDC